MPIKCRCGHTGPYFMGTCPSCEAAREVERDGVPEDFRKQVEAELAKPSLFAGRDFDDI